MSVITVVESVDETRRRLTRVLRGDGFEVVESASGEEGLRLAFGCRPDAALIELSPGEMSGLDLVRILRTACDVPILAMVKQVSPADVVRALEAGADDVIAEDCLAQELLARVHAAVRRARRRPSEEAPARQVATGPLVIDREAQAVYKHGQRVPLTRTEYRLLDAMAMRLGEISPHRYLLSTVWGDEYVDDRHYLRVYVGYLRAKLEDDPAAPAFLLNEWGAGYRLARLPAEEPAAPGGWTASERVPA